MHEKDDETFFDDEVPCLERERDDLVAAEGVREGTGVGWAA